MNKVEIKVLTLDHGKHFPLPEYATAGSAGMDLIAAVEGSLKILPGERAVVPTGICLSLPQGFEAQIRPRSGLAAKFGITVLNAPGTIDADYRGEILVILINLGQEPFEVTKGMRIAQMVIAPFMQAHLTSLAEFSEKTLRGEGGFGSTGLYVTKA